jgi:hypothetical protein
MHMLSGYTSRRGHHFGALRYTYYGAEQVQVI